jgi:hypothetical protein
MGTCAAQWIGRQFTAFSLPVTTYRPNPDLVWISCTTLRGLARERELTEINMVCLLRRVDAVTSIPREVLMRIPALAILATVMVWTAAPTLAQTYSPDYPVCLQVYSQMGGYIECAYTSLAQCDQSASGRAAQCVINPYFASAQWPRKRDHRRHPRVN